MAKCIEIFFPKNRLCPRKMMIYDILLRNLFVFSKKGLKKTFPAVLLIPVPNELESRFVIYTLPGSGVIVRIKIMMTYRTAGK
jgi:hypothetical protein